VGVLLLAFIVFTLIAPVVMRPRFSPRTKQREAMTNLKAISVAVRSYAADDGGCSARIAEIGFAPERANRYLYALSTDGPLELPGRRVADAVGVLADTAKHPELDNEALERGVPEALWDTIGLSTDGGTCEVTAIAVSNLDDDADLDVWTISTADRTIDGGVVGAFWPYQHLDDLGP
jgi:hypothetical protein